MIGSWRAPAPPSLRCLLWVLWSSLLSSCTSGVTQVVVSIDAESMWRDGPTAVRFVVRGGAAGASALEPPARDVTLMVGDGEAYAFPVDITVAPVDGDATRSWAVDATATNTVTNATATVRVRGAYVAGRTLRVSLLLEDSCAGVACSADQTCRANRCEDAALDGGPLDGGVDAGPHDQAVDAGPPDGGAEDLGAMDAAATDDGSWDAGAEPGVVHVSVSGDDSLDGGTVATAVGSIQRGIDLATACEPAPCVVDVEMGTYEGPVELATGVRVFGGFDPTFATVAGHSTIVREPSADPFVHTILADQVTDAELHHFDVRGADLSALAPGQGSVVTLWLRGGSSVRVEDVTLHGGDGREGASGTAGASGASRSSTGCVSGGNGRRQTSGCQGTLTGHGGSTSTRVRSGGGSWGAGGGSSGCGTAHCPPSPPGCTIGGTASTGTHGTTGPDANRGVHEGWGTLTAAGFGSSDGNDGGDGGDGGGGGGGGEGGDRYAPWCLCTHGLGQGGAGGNGGRGGCGGNGGRGGGGGGATFAVIVDASTLTFGDEVALMGGTGGQGGAGAAGGAAQSGFNPTGGAGPSASSCNSEEIRGCDGGAGGRGGNGAAGGRGAGGDGGPSVLIARREGGAISGSPSFVTGTGGARPAGDTSGTVVGPTSNNRAY
jgi:hypothetical protein